MSTGFAGAFGVATLLSFERPPAEDLRRARLGGP
jgi:hypothetical protein